MSDERKTVRPVLEGVGWLPDFESLKVKVEGKQISEASVAGKNDLEGLKKKQIQERLTRLLNEIHQELGIDKRVIRLDCIRLDEFSEGMFELEYEVECYATGGYTPNAEKYVGRI